MVSLSSLDINHEICLVFSAIVFNVQLLPTDAPIEECFTSLLHPEASIRTTMS